jgi:hypothetical protein
MERELEVRFEKRAVEIGALHGASWTARREEPCTVVAYGGEAIALREVADDGLLLRGGEDFDR